MVWGTTFPCDAHCYDLFNNSHPPPEMVFQNTWTCISFGGSDEKNGKKSRVFFPRKISVSVRVSTRSKRGGRARVIRSGHQHVHILLCHVLAISNMGAKRDIRCGHLNVSYLCTRKEALRMASQT